MKHKTQNPVTASQLTDWLLRSPNEISFFFEMSPTAQDIPNTLSVGKVIKTNST